MAIQALQSREATVPTQALLHAAAVTSQASGQSAPAGGNDLPHVAVPAVTDVHVAAALIDDYLRSAGRELSFAVDDATGIVVVSVRDPTSGELIRQMPSEEVLRIAGNLVTQGPRLIDELA
jgi:flagellar protein FlaG